MLNSRQRAQLRSIANSYDTIFQIGKGGINDALIKQIDEALEKRELIKIRTLETSPETSREAADNVAEAVKADVVQVIGSRFVTKKKPFSIRMLGSNILQMAIRLVTGKKITDPTSGMRAYNKKVIEEFVANASLTPEPDTLVYMMTRQMKVKEVQVEMHDREFGESYLNAFKSIEYMLSMMFSIVFIRAFTRKGGK